MKRAGGLWLIALVASTGCASSLSSRASAVRWVDTRQEVGSCKYLGVVDGSSSQTGVANISTGRNNARNEALEKAADKGATHVHWLNDDESFSGIRMSAEAYDCDERVAARDGLADDADVSAKKTSRVSTRVSEVSEQNPAPQQAKPPAEKSHSDTVGLGSCFFVSPDGIVVTNRHVVDGARKIMVVDASSARYPATVLRTSTTSDLVALDVPGVTSHRAVRIESSAGATLGEPIFTIGFPFATALGFDPKFADGSISGLRGVGDERLFQVTIPIQPGNSGGPVANDQGGVIGIVVARMDDLKMLKETGSLPQNLGFAVKADEMRELLRGVSLPAAKPAKTRAAAVKDVQAAACQVVAFSSDESEGRTSSSEVEAPLTKAQISSTIAALRAKITACKDQGEISTADEVALRVEVGPDGSVRSVTVNGNATSDDDVEACVLKAVRRVRFPRSAGGRFAQTLKL